MLCWRLCKLIHIKQQLLIKCYIGFVNLRLSIWIFSISRPTYYRKSVFLFSLFVASGQCQHKMFLTRNLLNSIKNLKSEIEWYRFVSFRIEMDKSIEFNNTSMVFPTHIHTIVNSCQTISNESTILLPFFRINVVTRTHRCKQLFSLTLILNYIELSEKRFNKPLILHICLFFSLRIEKKNENE